MRDDHSSRTPIARRLQQPTRTDGSGHRSSRPSACAEGGTPSLFGLAPGGVCRAAGVTAGAVRSYRTVSPLPRRTQPSAAVCSLWHFPWARARRTLSGTAGPRSPDFPPRQPFGFAGAAVRPTDIRGNGQAQPLRQEAGRVSVLRPREATVRTRPRVAIRFCSVARVDSSQTPSTRSGRKWRWNAVTTAWVAES